MAFPVFEVANVRRRTRYGKPSWPLKSLRVGEGFIVPIANGTDPDGRPQAYVRTSAWKMGKDCGITVSVNSVSGGLLISRAA